MYVIPISVLYLYHSSMNLYSCSTTTFHSLSISSTAIGRYPNIVLIMSCYIFFFSKNIVYRSSISVFIAKALNSIMKSTVFHFPCLKVSIFHLASAAFVLSLNVVLSSLTNSSQSWVSNSLSSLLSFLCAYIPATFPLRCAKIAVILLLVSITLLLLRNNCIPLYQSSNFVQSLSNHPGSETILFGVTACTLLFIVAGASATDISSSDYSFISLEALFVIFKNPSFSDNTLISSVLCKLILFFLWFMPHMFCSSSSGNFV